MQSFYFRDTDASGNAEYDISGKDYVVLMHTCYQYCAAVSFGFHPYSAPPHSLEKWRIPSLAAANAHYLKIGERAVHTRSGMMPFSVMCYELSLDVQEYILCIANSILGCGSDDLNFGPEDIAFFRDDGSIFLYVSSHNGEAYLTPHKNEEISEIISSGLWIPC